METGKSFKIRCSYIIGALLFTLFLSLAISWHSLLDFVIKNQLKLDPSSAIYKMWVKPSIPIYLEIYLFNFTNSEEFEREKSVIPELKEVGPFLFEETREKVDIIWSNDNDVVSFNQSKMWKLVEEKSENFSALVTNINPVAATIAYISRLWDSELQRRIVNTLINLYEPLFTTVTARQWLFDGIPDEFVETFEVLRTVTEIPIPYNQFGWFYDRNLSSSFDGIFTIKTGKPNIDQLGMMVEWNKVNRTEHYEGDCSMVYGSTGEILPPLKSFEEKLSFFSSEICSYITLKYSKEGCVENLSGYEYIGDESVFDNGTKYPENSCFVVGESIPSGSRNVSSCKFGSPAFISFPHFYLADQSYSASLKGMNPNSSKHKFRLIVEPKLGIPLKVDASFQINFLIDYYSWCDKFKNASKIYIPMLWFTQTVEITTFLRVLLRVVTFAIDFGNLILFGVCLLILLGYTFPFCVTYLAK